MFVWVVLVIVDFLLFSSSVYLVVSHSVDVSKQLQTVSVTVSSHHISLFLGFISIS